MGAASGAVEGQMATRREQKITDRIDLSTDEFGPVETGEREPTSKSTQEKIFCLDESVLSSSPALVVIYGANIGRIFNLDGEVQRVGRDEDCEIMLTEHEVSRSHCSVTVDAAGVTVLDLESTNGTFVNEEKVQERMLHDGDCLRIGGTMLKYLSRGNVEKTYHDEIVNRTNVDTLTGAFNRRYLYSVLHREIGRSTRHHRELSVIMLDIDRFKQINDVYGHLVGDSVLRAISTNIQANIRREDVMTRYGGEEFLLVLPETPYENAFVCAGKLRSMVAATEFRLADERLPVTISIGVASCREADDAQSLVEAADKALYRAKRSGRDRVCGRDDEKE